MEGNTGIQQDAPVERDPPVELVVMVDLRVCNLVVSNFHFHLV
jgi:hypothetical protein